MWAIDNKSDFKHFQCYMVAVQHITVLFLSCCGGWYTLCPMWHIVPITCMIVQCILWNIQIGMINIVFLGHICTELVYHYNDVIMGTISSQITSLTIVYSITYSDADQRKHQSSASLAFVRGIHRGPVNSPNKWPVTRKMFPFDDVIMDFKILRVASQAQYTPL